MGKTIRCRMGRHILRNVVEDMEIKKEIKIHNLLLEIY